MNHVNREIMKSAKKSAAVPKKRPPKTGTPVLTRFQDDDLERLDAWRRNQPDLPTRPEALKRLMDRGLSPGLSVPPGKGGAKK